MQAQAGGEPVVRGFIADAGQDAPPTVWGILLGFTVTRSTQPTGWSISFCITHGICDYHLASTQHSCIYLIFPQ